MLALNKGKPEQMNLKNILNSFLEFREEVISKRTQFDLQKARDKAHIFVGLVIANSNIDEIIEIIKGSKDAKDAREKLRKKSWKLSKENINFITIVESQTNQIKNNIFVFSEEQIKAILELRLQKLTALERSDIQNDLENLILDIKRY